ncbi:MAG: universal stress protein [Thermoleophilia bacterium]|nr:universal stress protein [Thermoleophilia bacterium]
MSLLVALSGHGESDARLLADAKALAEAGGWDVAGLHVGDRSDIAGLPDVDTEVIEEGEVAAQVARRAAADDVEVVALGLRTVPKPGIGSVAQALLCELGDPLLLVRPGMRPIGRLQRLLVPLEGSPSTSEAMRYADDAFCAPGREIVMLHVMTGTCPSEPGSLPAPRMVDQEQYEWPSWQEEFTLRFAQCARGGRHRLVARVGDPVATMVREARDLDAQLVVLSWWGTLAGERAPVVRAMFEESPCPLLLVPAVRPEWPVG